MRTSRPLARLGLAAVLAAGPDGPFPEGLDLPDGFQPEVIAIGPGPKAYFRQPVRR